MMIAESEIKARVRAIQQQQEAEIEAHVRAEAEAQARAAEDALDKQATQKRAQRIVKTRTDIAKKLDLAPLEVARVELREALDTYVAACAAYDRRYAECWSDVAALASSGPMPPDLVVTAFAISCDGHDYRKSRLHHMLIELARASVEAQQYPDKINFYNPPQD